MGKLVVAYCMEYEWSSRKSEMIQVGNKIAVFDYDAVVVRIPAEDLALFDPNDTYPYESFLEDCVAQDLWDFFMQFEEYEDDMYEFEIMDSIDEFLEFEITSSNVWDFNRPFPEVPLLNEQFFKGH